MSTETFPVQTSLVDLLCLGVKDAAWFFNTEPDEMTDMLENANPPMIVISYELSHNIVYAGLEFLKRLLPKDGI